MSLLLALAILVGGHAIDPQPAAHIRPAPAAAPRERGAVHRAHAGPSPRRAAVAGAATWYRYRAAQAAAGPGLRAFLGPSWRGTAVRVCSASACVRVVLTDWCACGPGRVVDLDARSFARLAPLSRGVLRVAVSRA